MSRIAVDVASDRLAAATGRELAADIDGVVAALDEQRRALAVIADTDTVQGGWPASAAADVLTAAEALHSAVCTLESAADHLSAYGLLRIRRGAIR